MVTTAARSREYLRKAGYIAECVEHRLGSFIRKDLFGFADVLAYRPDGIVLVQAYHKKEEIHHRHLLPDRNPSAKLWLESGGRYEHHLWHFKTKNKRKYWELERRNIVPV